RGRGKKRAAPTQAAAHAQEDPPPRARCSPAVHADTEVTESVRVVVECKPIDQRDAAMRDEINAYLKAYCDRTYQVYSTGISKSTARRNTGQRKLAKFSEDKLIDEERFGYTYAVHNHSVYAKWYGVWNALAPRVREVVKGLIAANTSRRSILQ
ncbi:TPA: LOW QUALITY PROTEIN: hypothetical protein N0F65_003037, partial [Lagenidium giganteum]